MALNIEMNDVYGPSSDIVAREIDGEVLIIPLISGMGDIEDELYSLNETGKVIWKLLDGERSVQQIIDQLIAGHDGDPALIKEDVFGLLQEFGKRKFLVKKTG
jgi:hypothetical protein